MSVHDWTRVEAGIFHHFHHAWIEELQRALNRRLPPEYYALAEQVAGGPVPDVLTLERPADAYEGPLASDDRGTVAVATAPPKAKYYTRAEEEDIYAKLASRVVIRHVTEHQVVAMIEIVSPGNKNSRPALNQFVRKASEVLRAGVHLLIVDLFPPGPRDPQGIHKAIGDEIKEEDFSLSADQPLTLVSYVAGAIPEAYIEPFAVGERLSDMPIFLTTQEYVPVPLGPTYMSAWEAVPPYWREVVLGRRDRTPPV